MRAHFARREIRRDALFLQMGRQWAEIHGEAEGRQIGNRSAAHSLELICQGLETRSTDRLGGCDDGDMEGFRENYWTRRARKRVVENGDIDFLLGAEKLGREDGVAGRLVESATIISAHGAIENIQTPNKTKYTVTHNLLFRTCCRWYLGPSP